MLGDHNLVHIARRRRTIIKQIHAFGKIELKKCWLADKEVMVVAIGIDGHWAYNQITDIKLKRDKDIVVALIKTNLWSSVSANDFPEYFDDYDVAMASANCYYHSNLKRLSDRLKDNFDVVFAHIKRDKYQLEWASLNLRDNMDMALFVVTYGRHTSLHLKYFSSRIQNHNGLQYVLIQNMLTHHRIVELLAETKYQKGYSWNDVLICLRLAKN